MALSTMPSSRSTWARAAISGTTPPKRACSSVCERTILDRIRPDPSLWRSTTAAAVSSQVVSIPSTSIDVSLPNLSPCAIGQSGVSRISAVALRGREVQSSVAAEVLWLEKSDAWPFSSPARIPTMRPPPRRCAPGVSRCCWRRCCGSSRSRSTTIWMRATARSSSPAPMRCAASNSTRRPAGCSKLPLFAVGEHTADAARARRVRPVMPGQRRCRGLARSRAGQREGEGAEESRTLLYLAGADLARDLAGELGERGFAVVTHTTYRMVPVPSLPREVCDAFAANRIEAVLHYSRRSARAFLEAARAGGVEISALVDPAMLHFRRGRRRRPRCRGHAGHGGGDRRTKMPYSRRWSVLCGPDRAKRIRPNLRSVRPQLSEEPS